MIGSAAFVSERPAPPTRQLVSRREATPFFVYLYVFSLVTPVYFTVGSLVFTSYRVALLIAFIPAVIGWLTGRAGKLRAAEILLICFVAWATIAVTSAHGFERTIEPSGVLLIETLGSYLLARVYVRNAATFLAVSRLLFIVVVALFPFAMAESLSSNRWILEALRPFANVHADVLGDMRLGLYRAQTVFQHPIHYGVFCASVLGLTLYAIARNRSLLGRLIRSAVVVVAAGFSLSTGAIVAITVQTGLAVWDAVTRGVRRRWALLTSLTVVAYVVVDVLSNRTPIHVFISYLTLNVGSSYNRILIWKYGTAEVLRNPLLGVGFGEWERPIWMGPSMDNFWLVIAVRYGLPALAFFVLAIVLILIQMGRLKTLDEETASYRKGLLISLVGLIIAGSTVHFWDSLYSYFMFLLGCGAWMADSATRAPALSRADDVSKRRLPYSRKGT